MRGKTLQWGISRWKLKTTAMNLGCALDVIWDFFPKGSGKEGLGANPENTWVESRENWPLEDTSLSSGLSEVSSQNCGMLMQKLFQKSSEELQSGLSNGVSAEVMYMGKTKPSRRSVGSGRLTSSLGSDNTSVKPANLMFSGVVHLFWPEMVNP